MKLNTFLRASACLAALSGAPPALADDGASSDSDTGEVILVIGQKDAPLTVVPRGLSVSLDHENFEAINAINVEDLMKYAPNFFVRKRFAGDDNAVVALRGANTVQSARTIVMVDGFVVSNFLGNRYDYPPKWNVVGPAEVRQFDLVYGPYSARYGGNSMGGVVSVNTEEPKASGAYMTLQAMAMPFREYGFDQTFTGWSVETGFTLKPANSPLSLRASYRHFRNTGQSMTYNLLSQTTGSGTAVNGAYVDPRLASPVFGAASPVDVTQDQLRLRLGYDLGGGWQADALGMVWWNGQELLDPQSWLTNAATGAPVYQGKVTFGGKTWNASGLTQSITRRREYLAGVKLAGPIAGWDFSLNLSRFWIPKWEQLASKDYLTGASLGAGTLTRYGNPGWYTGDLVLEKRLGAHKLAFGAQANLYETVSETLNTVNWKGATSPSFNSATYGKTSLWGLWAEDAVELGGDWVATAGLRFDQWHAFDGGIAKLYSGTRKDDAYPARHDSSLSPKLSLQGPLGRDFALQISLGTAKRFPTVGELFQGRFDDITQAIDPQSFDPNLRPERSQDANLMLRWNAGKAKVTASLFYQDIKDAIFSFQGLNQYGTVVSSYKNVDEVRQWGLELILEGKDLLLPGLDLDANLSWMDARTVKNAAAPAAEGAQFPRIPHWRANGNLRYRIADPLKFSLGWRYGSRPNSDLFGQSRGRAYGFQSEYFTVDTRLSWQVAKWLETSLGIDNLFNYQAYVAHPLPQRTFVADLKARW